MAKFIWRSGLTGGGDSLDGVSSSGLTTGDSALVLAAGKVYTYLYDAADAAVESSPDVIRPDDNTGAWTLQGFLHSDLLVSIAQLSTAPDAPVLLYFDGTNWTLTDTVPLTQVDLDAGSDYLVSGAPLDVADLADAGSLLAVEWPLVASDPVTPATGDKWINTTSHQAKVKTATGTIIYEAFQFVAD